MQIPTSQLGLFWGLNRQHGTVRNGSRFVMSLSPCPGPVCVCAAPREHARLRCMHCMHTCPTMCGIVGRLLCQQQTPTAAATRQRPNNTSNTTTTTLTQQPQPPQQPPQQQPQPNHTHDIKPVAILAQSPLGSSHFGIETFVSCPDNGRSCWVRKL